MRDGGWHSGSRRGSPYRLGPRRSGYQRWLFKYVMPVGVLGGLALTSTLVSASDPAGAISGCRVTDGDTIRCGDERIRLLGIDAPELPGHCRGGRRCVEGDPFASSASLAQAMGSNMTIVRVGTDRYGRTLATVSGPSGDLSCWQLEHAQAQYRADWDNGLRIGRICPKAVLQH